MIVSIKFSGIIPLDGPPTATAPTLVFFGTLPICSTIWRTDVPIGTSTTPGRSTDPLRLIILQPGDSVKPIVLKCSDPSEIMYGMFAKVSALLITVG